MKVHVTNIYGTNPNVPEAKAMENVVRTVKKMGGNELCFYCFDINTDNERDMSRRFDGILAGIEAGDIVIMQFPTWIGARYDNTFVEKVKCYPRAKLVIFVHDIAPLMIEEKKDEIKEVISILNKADALILPSPQMEKVLVEHGLTVDKVFYQEIWDYPMSEVLCVKELNRRIFFTGSARRFEFVQQWDGKTKLELYGWEAGVELGRSVHNNGYRDNIELMTEMSQGGFGMIWAGGMQLEYYKLNQPLKIATYLAAGIPVIVQNGINIAEFVEKNQVGFVVDSLEEADYIVQNITEEKYKELLENVKNVQYLITKGYYTEKLLSEVVVKMATSQQKEVAKKPIINVIDNVKTLEWVKKNQSSLARFGDGEFDLLAGKDIPYQKQNERLIEDMKEIIARQSDEDFVVCMPDVFKRQERYTEYCRNFWNNHIEKYEQLYRDLSGIEWFGSTFFSRPYIDMEDKTKCGEYFEELKSLWQDREILIVEGATSRAGVGNDLFEGASLIERIVCPSHDAYDNIEEIEAAIRRFGHGKLILLMLGPTAKVIAYHLSKEKMWVVDIGHIDSEYEWYKMGATQKVKLPNKHTAEFNYDENIEFMSDEKYESQIVCKIGVC